MVLKNFVNYSLDFEEDIGLSQSQIQFQEIPFSVSSTLPETLESSKSSEYIYHLSSPSTLSKIDPENKVILQIYDRSTIGQDVLRFKIISKRYMVNLNREKNYFKLCNLTLKKKEGGIKLRNPDSQNNIVKCVSFDVTRKGNRLFAGCYDPKDNCYNLSIYKITQSGFIFKRKIDKFFEEGIYSLIIVEKFFKQSEEQEGYLLISGKKDVSLYSYLGYKLKKEVSASESSKSKCLIIIKISDGNVSLCFDNGVTALSGENQSLDFYLIEQFEENFGNRKTSLNNNVNHLAGGYINF